MSFRAQPRKKKFKPFVDISVTGSTETLDPTFGKKLSVNTKRISRNGTTESKSEANDSVKTLIYINWRFFEKRAWTESELTWFGYKVESPKGTFSSLLSPGSSRLIHYLRLAACPHRFCTWAIEKGQWTSTEGGGWKFHVTENWSTG